MISKVSISDNAGKKLNQNSCFFLQCLIKKDKEAKGTKETIFT